MTIKLLILVGNLERGGAEKQLLSILKFNPTKEVAIHLVNLSRGPGGYWENAVKSLPINYTLLGPGTGQIDRIKTVYRINRSWKPDVIWAWHFFTGIYALPTRFSSRPVKLVQGVRNDVDYLLSVHRWALWLLRRVDAVVANTYLALTQLSEREPRTPRGYVLPNILELPDDVVPVRSSVGIIGFCGNIHERKGIDVFLHAAARLVEGGYRGVFVVAGNGDTGPYKNLVKSLGLEASVEFRGDVECDSEIRNFDLFVLPSRHEGSPNVLLEAMGSGVPVIGTNVGGVPEIMRHESEGLLCNSESSDELASAMKRMIDSKQLRQSCAKTARAAVMNRAANTIAKNNFVEILKAIQAQPDL